MWSRLLLFMFFISCCSVFAQEKKMTANEIVALKKMIQSESVNIQTIQSEFIQYKHLSFLSKDIETTGKLYYKKPNVLSWRYTKPYQYSVLFKNNKVYINDQGKKSTIDANGKMFEKINKMIVGSVSGNMFDDQDFDISYLKDRKYKIVKLSPKTSSIKKYIKEIVLYFDENESTVAQVKLIEPSDDYTRIVFKNKQINAKIDSSVFTN